MNAHQWSLDEDAWRTRIESSPELVDVVDRAVVSRLYAAACDSMLRLNRVAAAAMRAVGAHAATDVTGFGVLGHASNLAAVQTAAVRFELTRLPLLAGALPLARVHRGFGLLEGRSSETSGGLLVALAAADVDAFVDALDAPAWIVGRVIGVGVAGDDDDGDTTRARTAVLADDVEFFEV